MPDSREARDHAAVIGASIAGLSAAKVLLNFYSRVTVYERDELPDSPAHRATIPQDRHLHLLMARGATEFDSLFPGFVDGHGGRQGAHAGKPARLHPSRRDRPCAGDGAHVARRIHRLRAQPSASGVAAAHPRPRLRQRHHRPALGGRTTIRPATAAGDPGATGSRPDPAGVDPEFVPANTWSSTRPVAAPGCRCGSRSGDFNAPSNRR